MARFKELYQIIEDVVNNISWNIEVSNITDNLDGTFTLDVGCTAFLNECTVFSDGVNDWQVIEFTFNKQLIVKAYGHSNTWSLDSFTLGNPTFMHGTVRLANAEYTMQPRKQDILPIIYFYNAVNENVSLVSKDAVERTATARIFILMSNNFEDFIQVDYDRQILAPMSNIEEQLINGLKTSKNLSKFTESYSREFHDQFGYTDRNGELERIFSDELSDLELQIPVNINKCKCEDCKC